MIEAYLKESILTQTKMLEDSKFLEQIDNITKKVVETLKRGNKLLFI